MFYTSIHSPYVKVLKIIVIILVSGSVPTLTSFCWLDTDSPISVWKLDWDFVPVGNV